MSRSPTEFLGEARSMMFERRVLGLLAGLMAWGLSLTPVHSRPASPDALQARIDATLRQVNGLLAEHPNFTAPFGFSVMTLVVDGGCLVKEYGTPSEVANSEQWKAEIIDLRAKVEERFYESHGTTSYDIQCRAEGPLRPERMNRCWWLGDRTHTLVPDGDLWHGAGPIASRAIAEGVEELIRLLQRRERAIR